MRTSAVGGAIAGLPTVLLAIRLAHTILITGIDGTPKVLALGSAKTSFQLDDPGTCKITGSIPSHVASGMSATLVVGERPSAGTPNPSV